MLHSDARVYAVRTDEFDGPLALLLYLVRQQGVDVRDLRVAPITNAYLSHLVEIEAADLEIAGEFLVMAATLCFLKSRDILPRPVTQGDEAEDDPDPEALRAALIRRLQEYQRYADAAQQLAARDWLGRDTFAPPGEEQLPEEQLLDPTTDAMGLAEIYQGLLDRHAAPPPVHQVQRDPLSIEDVANWMLNQLREGPRDLRELMGTLPEKNDKVMAFFSALELARMQMLDIEQDRHLGPIVVTGRVAAEDADLQALIGSA